MTLTTYALTLGAPFVRGPLAIFPVHGPPPRLAYRTLAAAFALGATVKERPGGGAVGEVVVDNPTDLPLLVYEGEEILGAQQNRTFDGSVLVAARSSTAVPVSCVERGRWDTGRGREAFAPAPQAADPGLRRVKRATANAHGAAGRPARPDQGEVWAEVRERMAAHGAPSPSEAMHDVYERRRGDLGALTRDLAPADDQIGALAAVHGAPIALDVVSRPEAFAQLLERLAQGYALDALGTPGPAHNASGSPDRARAGAFLDTALSSPRRPLPTPGLGRAAALEGPGVTGAALEHEGELIALSAFPDRRDPKGPGAPPIARPSRRRPG